MRWTIVCQEVPYPPMHGGTVDMWRRLVALHEFGVRVHLVCWANGTPLADDRAILAEACDRLRLLQYRQEWWDRVMQLPRLLRLPAPVSTRRVARAQFDAIVREAREFGSQLIFSDGLMGGRLSRQLAAALRLPRFVRSHNIEHVYWRRLLNAARGANRLQLALRLRNLERFEVEGLRTARQFFDISADDLEYWRSRGLANGVWLPPLAADERLAIQRESEAAFDVAFVGNLRTPNNVSGVRWFVEQVLPLVEIRLGRMPRVLIAGSQPTAELLRACGAVTNLEVRPNFNDLAEALSAAKVLVNPILTGSGVAVKTVDMLLSGRPVVSTSHGVNGFPPEVKRLSRIADTPQAFADSICAALTEEHCQDQIEVVRTLFGRDVIARLIDRITHTIGE